MRKYGYIYISEVMSTIQYIMNILFDLIGYVIHILIFFYLWSYIYEDPSQIINGYTKTQMVWYIIFTEILWGSTGGRKFCRRICNDVKGGNIAYQLNKPYSYISYIVSSHLGETTIKTLISIVIGMTFGVLFLKEIPQLSVIGIVIVIVAAILAVVINTLLVATIGLFSFFIEDANPIYWVYSKMILILGTVFPVEFFPGVLETIIKFTPIYVTCYGPSKLFVDYDAVTAIKVLLAQLIYLVVSVMLSLIVFKKGVKKLNVNGG